MSPVIERRLSVTVWQSYTKGKTKNSSGDEIANVNLYAVRPEATQIR